MLALKGNRGLSVIEMLSTVTIILILAALLLGAMGAAREKTRQAKCINNQHQLIDAVLLYALDEDKFPESLVYLPDEYVDMTAYSKYALKWSNNYTRAAYAEALQISYFDNAVDILRCPKVYGEINDNPPVYSYGLNSLVANANYHAIVSPSEVMVIADSDTPMFTSVEELPSRHLFGALAGYADGHVEWAKDFVPISTGGDDINFDIDGGGIVPGGDYTTQVNPLLAQISYGGWYWNCNRWCYPDYMFDFLDVYLAMEVTDPETGEVSNYDITDPEGEGIDGWWLEEDFSSFSMFEVPEVIEEDSEINFVTTSKWWLPRYEWQGWRRGWKTVWVQETYVTYNTNDHADEQVYVLRDGDQAPEYEGFMDPGGQQTSVAEAISDYLVEDEFGNLIVSLEDTQAIYFWEISHNYYDYGEFEDPPSGVDFNDLVFFIDFEALQE